MAWNRRQFLKHAGSTAAFGVGRAGAKPQSVSIVLPAGDPVAVSGPVKWASGELRDALAAHQVDATMREDLARAPAADLCVVVAGGSHPLVRAAGAAAEGPEALAIGRGRAGGRQVVAASGGDARGAVYAVL